MSEAQGKTRFCTVCGTKLSETSVFCGGCGAKTKPPASSSGTGTPAPSAASAIPPTASPAALMQPATPPTPVRSKRPVAIIAAAVAALVVAGVIGALFLTGVVGPFGEEDSSEPQVAAADTSEETPDDPAGDEEAEEQAEEPTPASPNEGLPISTPERGGAERTALMDAARARTGSSAQFLVWQLYVQGDVAIGDIQEYPDAETTPGRRWLLVWERTAGSWTGVSHVEYLDATKEMTRRSSAALTEAILADVDFMMPAPRPPGIEEAARAARDNRYGSYDVFIPTRLPEGASFDSIQVENDAVYLYYRVSGSRVLYVFNGWGDSDIWSMEEVLVTPANWGEGDGSHARAGSTHQEIHASGRVPSLIGGPEIPEHLLRAVAMSLQRVVP